MGQKGRVHSSPNLQLPSPCLSDLRVWDPGRVSGPGVQIGSDPRRPTGEGDTSGGAFSNHPTLGFSHLCFPQLQRGERAPPVGQLGEVRVTPEKVGR